MGQSKYAEEYDEWEYKQEQKNQFGFYASNKTKFSPTKQVFQRQIFHRNYHYFFKSLG